MATYYVDFVNGLDANNGLGPDASAVTNKPWKTLAKLLGAAGMASGDTAYVAPGTQRETVTVAMTSPTVETQILADPGNAQGFKTSGGVLVPPGPVAWSAYTTNDTTTPAAAALLTLAGRDFLTFQGFVMVGGNATATCVDGNTSNSTNITFRDCLLIPGAVASPRPIAWTGLADVAAHWLLDRCTILGSTNGVAILGTAPTSSVADYDIDFVIQNCLFLAQGAGATIQFLTSGALAFKPGGLKIWNTTFLGGGSFALNVVGTTWSTSVLSTVYNCLIFSSSGLSCGSSGPLAEDYNYLFCSTARTNVATGTHSVVGPTYALGVELGQSSLFGMLPRPFGMPTAGSPFLGFGNQASGPAVDLLNRARPSGGGSVSNAIGALERHDTAAKETGTTDAGGVGLVITGPGDHEFRVPVAASATVLSVRARYDTNHGAGSKPQALLLANGEIGVTAQTLTMSAAVDTWETLTFGSITPSRAGWVTIRLVSRAAAGTGKAFFDTAGLPDLNLGDFAYFNRGEPVPVLSGAGAAGGGILRSPGMAGGLDG